MHAVGWLVEFGGLMHICLPVGHTTGSVRIDGPVLVLPTLVLGGQFSDGHHPPANSLFTRYSGISDACYFSTRSGRRAAYRAISTLTGHGRGLSTACHQAWWNLVCSIEKRGRLGISLLLF